MSLTADWSRVDPKYTSNATPEEWERTQSIMFSTIVTGINDLTIETAPEFYARLTVWERLIYGKEVTTAADVAHRVGLRTNASLKTPAQFMRGTIGQEMANIKKNFGYFADATTQSIKTV